MADDSTAEPSAESYRRCATAACRAAERASDRGESRLAIRLFRLALIYDELAELVGGNPELDPRAAAASAEAQ